MVFLLFLFLLLTCLYLFKIYKSDAVHPFLTYALMVKFGMWTLFPAVLSVVKWELSDFITMGELPYKLYLKYAVIDAIYVFLVHFIFYYLLKTNWLRGIKLFQTKIQNSQLIINGIAYLTIITVLISTFANNYTYEELNNMTVNKPFIEVVEFFTSLGLASFFTLVIFFKDNLSKKVFYILHAVYLIFAFKNAFILGSRIAILGPVFIYLYYFLVYTSFKWKLIAALPLTVIIYAVVLFMPVLSQMRLNDMGSNEVQGELKRTTMNIVLTEAITKTNAVYYGAFLVEGEGVGAAGIQPYINSALSFLPRFIFTNRPVPTSKNGKLEGTPPRVAADVMYPGTEMFNVGVADSEIALWHGGIVACVFNIIYAAFLLLFLTTLIRSRSYFAFFVTMLFIKVPTFGIWGTFDGCIRDFPRYLLLYLVFYLVIHYLKINKIIVEK